MQAQGEQRVGFGSIGYCVSYNSEVADHIGRK